MDASRMSQYYRQIIRDQKERYENKIDALEVQYKADICITKQRNVWLSEKLIETQRKLRLKDWKIVELE